MDVLGEAGPAVAEVVGELAADSPASSSRVATVMRDVCEVTPPKPTRSRALRRSPLVLLGSRSRSWGLGKRASTAIPITLAVVLLTFGALVVALLPLVFALTDRRPHRRRAQRARARRSTSGQRTDSVPTAPLATV